MKRLLAVTFITLAFVTPAFAELDVEGEKRIDAQREAAKQAATAKQAEAQRQKNEAMEKANAAMNKRLTEAQRKALGLPPAGSTASK